MLSSSTTALPWKTWPVPLSASGSDHLRAKMRARSEDTDPEAERFQIELLRRAGPARRAHLALSLSAQVIGLARRAARRSLPDASTVEVDLRFVELNYGRELASDLRSFLASRRP